MFEASRKGKASFMSLLGPGVRPNGLNLAKCISLYNVIVIPRALFGCKVWNQLKSQDILILERMQRFYAKVIKQFVQIKLWSCLAFLELLR